MAMAMIISEILGLYIGKPKLLRAHDGAKDDEYSSIGRTETNKRLYLSKMGLAGDEFADPKHHGGIDKALHIYPFEHYRHWNDILGDHDLLQSAGSFGENISASGMTEDKICVGDHFQMGDAIVECSHGRQPCWKIEAQFKRKNMVANIIQHGHCGIYFRVIQEGYIGKGDMIRQVENKAMEDMANESKRWSIAQIFHLLYSGAHLDRQDDVHSLIALPALAEAWKKRARALII